MLGNFLNGNREISTVSEEPFRPVRKDVKSRPGHARCGEVGLAHSTKETANEAKAKERLEGRGRTKEIMH